MPASANVFMKPAVRAWPLMHFPAAVEASIGLCEMFGEMACDSLIERIAGTAPLRAPVEALSR